jgi:hypothetical protein
MASAETYETGSQRPVDMNALYGSPSPEEKAAVQALMSGAPQGLEMAQLGAMGSGSVRADDRPDPQLCRLQTDPDPLEQQRSARGGHQVKPAPVGSVGVSTL